MSFKHKYQFTILNSNDRVTNTAATKAVIDCANILEKLGYQNFTITANSEKEGPLKFYSKAFISICKMLLKVKKGSLVAVQYPMLNNVFKYFVTISKLKSIKFFCIIHDVESLRLGGNDKTLVKKEIENLNFYDALIVHNDKMLDWLKQQGIRRKMITLQMFDYLTTTGNLTAEPTEAGYKSVAFAGNLSKSKFVYCLDKISSWNFNLYGPNYKEHSAVECENVSWKGSFAPDDIVNNINGRFGLVWDGDYIDKDDGVWSNYLRYNNPHKVSLYLAAGIPIIAPKSSAISTFIEQQKVGLLIDNLYDLFEINLSVEQYKVLKQNCLRIKEKVISGYFCTTAVELVEQELDFLDVRHN